MIGGYGHDDKVCAYPAVMAALDVEMPEQTCITYLTDKEETGSDGNTGMQSDFLRFFIMTLQSRTVLTATVFFQKAPAFLPM